MIQHPFLGRPFMSLLFYFSRFLRFTIGLVLLKFFRLICWLLRAAAVVVGLMAAVVVLVV